MPYKVSVLLSTPSTAPIVRRLLLNHFFNDRRKHPEESFGPKHPDAATSLNDLAGLYDNQGQYPNAEPLYQRGAGDLAKGLGPGEPKRGDMPGKTTGPCYER
jgi:hypothetical protein